MFKDNLLAYNHWLTFSSFGFKFVSKFIMLGLLRNKFVSSAAGEQIPFIFLVPGPPRLASATCGARSASTVLRAKM